MSAHQTITVVIPTYRDGARAVAAAESVLRQRRPQGMSLQIILVDDGSGDETTATLLTIDDPNVQVLALGQNQGRSGARNAGANQARGEIVMFMDCDCLPLNDMLLISHVSALSDGQVASTGHVTGVEIGFWGRYQRDASARRDRQYRQGFHASGSSGNLAVRKIAFQQVGGFDIQYGHYGFEDRDLLLRLAEVGRIGWSSGVGVRHLDTLTLGGVSIKMIEAGEHTSALFAERHPTAYQTLGYAALDTRRHRWLSPIAAAMGPQLPALARLMEPMLRCKWMPYIVSKAVVKMISAMSFSYGTTRYND
jgi:glycosyltransferase involved in cell wall biosynthesis